MEMWPTYRQSERCCVICSHPVWITWGRFWKGIDMIHIQPLLVLCCRSSQKTEAVWTSPSPQRNSLILFSRGFFFSVLVVLWNWHYQQNVRDINIWRFQQLKLFQAQWHLQKKCVLFLYFLLLRSNEWPKLKHPLLHFIIWPISNLT